MDIVSISVCALLFFVYAILVKCFLRQDGDYDTYRLKLLAARLKAALVCFVPAGLIFWIITSIKP